MAVHPGLNARYTVDQKKGEKTMAYLKGYVDHIRFRNEDNGYTVLSLDVDGDEEAVVGSFPFLNDGEYISLEGDYVDHPVHGPQFQMRTYEIVAPDDIDSMERYLGSGAIKGIGAALAERIVRRFDFFHRTVAHAAGLVVGTRLGYVRFVANGTLNGTAESLDVVVLHGNARNFGSRGGREHQTGTESGNAKLQFHDCLSY